MVVIILCWFGFDKQREWIIEKLLVLTDQQPSMALHLVFFIILGMLIIWVFKELFRKEKFLSHSFRAFVYGIVVLYLYYRIRGIYDFKSFPCGLAYFDLILFGGYVLFCYDTYRLYRPNVLKAPTDGFLGDSPITGGSDDKLGYQNYAKAVKSFMDNTDTSMKSFSIGVEGIWGQGKTSFVNLLKNELSKDNYIIVDFNARASAGASEIQEDFLSALRNALKDYYVGISGIVKEYGKALQVTEDYNPAFKFLQIGRWPNLADSWESLEKAIKNIGKRIVICVDDLDRLTGEEILEVCKVIDKNGSFPHVFFIASYDRIYVQDILKGFLKTDKTDDFLDKYINIEFSLPKKQYLVLLDELVRCLEHSIQIKEITAVNLNHIKFFLGNHTKIIEKRLSTMRDIKRFYNQFRFAYRTVQDDVNFEDYFLLELMRYKHKNEYDKLRQGDYTSWGSEMFDNKIHHSDELIYLKDIENHNLPKSWDILIRMFPESSRDYYYNDWYRSRWNRICNVLSNDIYFYQHSDGTIYNKELQGLFTLGLQEAVNKIDTWGDNTNSVRSFLLTRDVFRLNSKKNFSIYIPITIYCSYKFNDYMLRAAVGSFIITNDHDKDLAKIKRIYGFDNDTDYKNYVKELLDDLSMINISAVYSYMNALYTSLIQEPLSSYHAIFSMDECKEYLLCLLKDYLKTIEDKNWNARVVWEISRITKRDSTRLDQIIMDDDAKVYIRSSMIAYPEKYVDSILTHYFSDGLLRLTMHPLFLAYQIFDGWENFYDFLKLVDKSDKISEKTKDTLKTFWTRFRDQEYSAVIFEGNYETITAGDYNAYYKLLCE